MMGCIVFGLIIGLLFGVLFGLAVLEYMGKLGAGFATLMLCCAIGVGIGWFNAVEASSKYVAAYTATKQTIESSMDTDSLTGFERMELVNLATEHNRTLSERKYTASRWYGFTEDKRVLDLEYIVLD